MATLMVSVSGIRGLVGDGLDPQTIVKYTSAYADFVRTGSVVVGRDSRISGEMVRQIVCGTLLAKGLDVIDIGICPTPTVQYTVKTQKANGGIAISASHNPNEWNALKLLNSTGQFMTPDEHLLLKSTLDSPPLYKSWDRLGKYLFFEEGLCIHKNDVLRLPFIDVEAIRKRKFRVLADCVNGAGYMIIPELLRDFGCDVIELDCEDSGIFPRLPEPLPENLTATMEAVKRNNADLGVVVDPDVDRLVLITNTGEPFIEENTITQVVKFILSKTKGEVVVNLSTTRAVEDVAAMYNCKVHRSPVGEANVVKKMKEVRAVIGGEGSGGVIFPELHYGRDALVGIALTLQHLLEFGGTSQQLKESLPQYVPCKKKIGLKNIDPDTIIYKLTELYKNENINIEDGLRIDFPDHWAHIRKSNTEPILRILVEARTSEEAAAYSERYLETIRKISGNS